MHILQMYIYITMYMYLLLLIVCCLLLGLGELYRFAKRLHTSSRGQGKNLMSHSKSERETYMYMYVLMHIDVLMLCRKFQLIPTSIFQVMTILKNQPIFENTLYYSPCFFPKNGSEITKKFYYIF